MQFEAVGLDGVWIIHPQKFHDERGFFTGLWDQDAFVSKGLAELIRCNLAYNAAKGTLRGLHYQLAPFAEAKLIRCTRGQIYDVGVDLRPESATFKQWFGLELHADEHLQLYLPAGFAHGYLTLCDDCEVAYQTSNCYKPESARGLRWNDPQIGIEWPADITLIAPRDAEYPDFNPDLVLSQAG